MITELRNQLQDKNNNEVKKCESDISCPCPDSKLVQTADCYNEWKKKEKSLKDEIEKRQAEIDRLKEKCKQLEKNLANAKEQTENLQHAVDLYLNSINVLEASEERSKLEIEQQRMTIANLQEALVNVKHELEEIKGRNQQDFNNQQQMVNIMYMNLLDMETKRDDLRMELSKITEAYKQLNDVNFELEVEHFNTLQDTTILETQLIKYQNQLRNEERAVQFLNEDLRVLQQEKNVHEQIISYFKNEMSNMSGELAKLQGILEASNDTCKKENQKLVDTVTNLENINQQLQSQLRDNQQKLLRENEANIDKINELELAIKQKDMDLELHDQEINRLTVHLNTITKQNQELNKRINQLNMYCQHNENNESDRDVIIKELSGKIQMLEQTNQKKIDELIKENQQLRQILEDAKKELEEIRDNKELSRTELIKIKETLQKKEEEAKLENMNLLKKYEDTKNQLCSVVNDKNKKEDELIEMKRKYEGILQELKESLSKINVSIIDGKFVKNHNYFNNTSCCCNLIDMCKSEIRLTETLFKHFKDEFTKLLDNLNEMYQQNNDLINQLEDKGNERLKNQQELQQIKRPKQQCDGYLDEFIEFVKFQIKNVRSMEDYNTTTIQEEISLLKDLIKEIIQEQINFSKEKDKLLCQINCLQAALKKHEDANRLLHSQYETNYLELKNLLDNNKLLQQEKDDMNNELEALQNHCCCLEKRNRQLNEITKNLESELIQTKAKRDDICAESKLVIDCVRTWLNEQKKINNEIQQRKFGSCKVQQCNNPSIPNKSTNCPAPPYDWNQNLRIHFPDPVRGLSPDSCSLDDDDDDDGDEDEDDDDDDDDDDDTTDIDQDDDFVRRTEKITRQIRCSNRCFKNRFPNCYVPKND